jgi:hypothetical protein
MKLPWFKLYGIFYFPCAISGWLIMITGIIFAIYSFIEIDSKSHSASDTIRPFFIEIIILWAVYSLIAFLTSRDKDQN